MLLKLVKPEIYILFAVAVRVGLWGNALALSTVRSGELQELNTGV